MRRAFFLITLSSAVAFGGVAPGRAQTTPGALGDALSKTAPSPTTTVTQVAQPVTQAVTQTAAPVTQAAAPVTQAVTQAAAPVTQTVTETAKPVTQTVTETAKPVTQTVTETAARAPKAPTPVSSSPSRSASGETRAPAGEPGAGTPAAGPTARSGEGRAGGTDASADRPSATAGTGADATATRRASRTRARRAGRTAPAVRAAKIRRLVEAESTCLMELSLQERRVVVLRAALNRPEPRTRGAVARIIDLSPAKVLRIERRAVRQLRAGCGGPASTGVTTTAALQPLATTVSTVAFGTPAATLLAQAGDASDVTSTADTGFTGSSGRKFDSDGSSGSDGTRDSLNGAVEIPGTEPGERLVTVTTAASEAGGASSRVLAALFAVLAMSGALALALGGRRGDRLFMVQGALVRRPVLLGGLKVVSVVVAGLLVGAALGLLAGALFH